MSDFLLHVDVYIADFVKVYGTLTYGILFAIIFAETGLIVTPFLPGDSLLFAAGALAATQALSIGLLIPVLIVAAVLGDAVNYSVGRRLARTFLDDAPDTGWIYRVVKREHVRRARTSSSNGMAARPSSWRGSCPIVRTFVPFVAGGAHMTYRVFAIYNVTGAIAWVGICVGAGYLFGNIPVVKENFELVVVGNHRRLVPAAGRRSHSKLAPAPRHRTSRSIWKPRQPYLLRLRFHRRRDDFAHPRSASARTARMSGSAAAAVGIGSCTVQLHFARARHQTPLAHHVPLAGDRDGHDRQACLHCGIQAAALEGTEVSSLAARPFGKHDQRQAPRRSGCWPSRTRVGDRACGDRPADGRCGSGAIREMENCRATPSR